jgi:hypothetical protein
MIPATDEAYDVSVEREVANISITMHGDFALTRHTDIFVTSGQSKGPDTSDQFMRAVTIGTNALEARTADVTLGAWPLGDDFKRQLTLPRLNILRRLFYARQVSIGKAKTLAQLPDFTPPVAERTDPNLMWQAVKSFVLYRTLLRDHDYDDESLIISASHMDAKVAMHLFTGLVRYSTLSAQFLHVTERVHVMRNRGGRRELMQAFYRDSRGVIHAECGPYYGSLSGTVDGDPNTRPRLLNVLTSKRVPRMLCLSDYRLDNRYEREVYAFGLNCGDDGTSIEALFYTFPESTPSQVALTLLADSKHMKRVFNAYSYVEDLSFK